MDQFSLGYLKVRFEKNKFHKRKNDECWKWYASTGSNGYGNIRYGSSYIGAHRASYMIYNGPIPNGYCVCHSCDNPVCVNPNHLWLGTIQDNIDDKVKKGRVPSGDNHPRPFSKRKFCKNGHSWNYYNTGYKRNYRILGGPKTRYCKECHKLKERKRRLNIKLEG